MLSIKYLIPSYQCSGHSYIEYFTILHISSCEIKSTYYQWPLVKGDEPAGCPGETRVARKDDPNNIFNKALDFSRDTLEKAFYNNQLNQFHVERKILDYVKKDCIPQINKSLEQKAKAVILDALVYTS